MNKTNKRPTVTYYLVVFLLVAALLALFAFQTFFYFKYINDDAYITLRYAHNFANGHGPYFNPGEHVEGYTNFLLMLADTCFIKWLGPHLGIFAAKTIGLISGVLAILFTFYIAWLFLKKNTESFAFPVFMGFVAAGLVVSSPSFNINCYSGLETAIFAMLLIAGATLGTLTAQKQRWRGAGIAFGLAVITRPEGIALYGFYFIGQFITGLIGLRSNTNPDSSKSSWISKLLKSIGRPVIVDAFIVLGFFLAQLAFRFHFYDGELLPNTYYAKLGTPKGALAAWYIRQGLLVSCFGIPGIAVAIGGLLLDRKRLIQVTPLAFMAIGGACLPFVTGIGWMIGYRLVIPYLPVLSVLVVIGWGSWNLRFGKTLIGVVAAIMLFIVPITWVLQDDRRGEFALSLVKNQVGYHYGHIALADWLKTQTRPGDIIALTDIGIVGYELIDRKIIDISGLTDRYIAKSAGAFLDKQYDPGYVFDQNPQIIIIVFSNKGMKNNKTYQTWTNTESTLINDPRFKNNYQKKTDCSQIKGFKEAKWACAVGADAAFNNGAAIDADFFLTVYQRN